MKNGLFFILLFSCQFTFAQYGAINTETSSAKKSLRYAQQFINLEQYELAFKQLKHTIKIKDDFAIAHRELGRVLLELKRYSEAIEAYETSFDLDNKLSRAAFFECGEAHFKSNDIEKAKYYYAKYQEYKGGNYANKQKESGLEITYDKILSERAKNVAYLAKMPINTDIPRPTNIGTQINTEQDEYLPTITSDGLQMVFTRQISKDNEDIMISEYKNGSWQKGKSFGNSINTNKNEGMAKFEAHGKSFYFAGCMRSDTEGGCDIYRAILKAGKVTEVKRLDGHINSDNWDSQPTITCDGQAMYFSSSRQGGIGGADLYVSHLQANGEWGIPKNLGPTINTEGDEEAPFISSDGGTLYFSSNGHDGQGDGDLFIAQRVGSSWASPENMGFPINSPAKELGFYIQGDGKTAYFASARNEGEGGLDIYKLELPPSLRPAPMVHLEGYVKDMVTEEAVATTVRIGRESDRWEVKTDEDGWFFICLPGDKGYSFQVNEKGYEYLVEADFLAAQDNATAQRKDLFLKPKAKPKLVAKHVPVAEKRIQFFFDFDSYKLTDNAVEALEMLSDQLTKEDWKVEVVGYADSKGDVQYNKILSEKRASAIVDYLKKEGIRIENVIRNEGKGSISGQDKDDTKYRRVDVILRKN